MLSDKLQNAMNDQIKKEFYSSYLYLSMASYFVAQNLEGMAAWMRIQVDEERMHAMKFLDFICDRNGRVILEQIDKPKSDWASPLEAFQNALEHERLISQKINELADLAVKDSDHAAAAFLQWFVTEQVEEEANVQAIVGKLELIKDNGMGLLMIDQQLGQRTPSAAAPAGEPAA